MKQQSNLLVHHPWVPVVMTEHLPPCCHLLVATGHTVLRQGPPEGELCVTLMRGVLPVLEFCPV
jgi:hypothetical protein